ncbi:MAG TPA: hypothetical protein VN247_05650 [Arenimonas sp.]|nr:hypothetical protein [Arenimonas sp.]
MKNIALLLVLLPIHFTHAAKVESWQLPTISPSAQPNLTKNTKGELILSWVERTNDGHRMMIAHHQKGQWSKAKTVAEGNNWFVNWADFPSTVSLADGTIWAHYLVKSSPGTYAYDVVMKNSKDNGKSWSQPIVVNDDGTKTEHGFVSLWPWSSSEVAITWLDGRKTVGTTSHDHHTMNTDADSDKVMTLRAAVFANNGKKSKEWLIDQRTCDCCQTDAALTDKGPIIIYRDRNMQEIRDVYTSRFIGNRWTAGQAVAKDNWLMPACPVNGPSISAFGNKVWAAWYTGANNTSAIRLAYSNNSGETYTATKNFMQGTHIQGRVDITGDAAGAWFLWSEERATQSLWIARFDTKLNVLGKPIQIAQLAGRGRATGFAKMQTINNSVFVVWTDVINGKPVLRGATVQ